VSRALAVAVLTFLADYACAVGLGIHPSRFDASTSPGSSRKLKFMVTNTEERLPLRVHFYVMDVVQAPDGSADLVDANTTAWSAATWIRLKTRSLELDPGARGQVLYEVRVPPGATGGGYAAIIAESAVPNMRARGIGSAAVLEDDSADPSAAKPTTIVIRIPFLLYVRASGTEVYRAQVRSVRAASTDAGKPVRWLLTVRNQGNVLIRPAGTLNIEQAGMRRSLDANPGTLAIFPGATRTFAIEDPAGAYTAGMVRIPTILGIGATEMAEGDAEQAFQ
jgi:P pilus assembly chaperone PapD